MYPFSKRSALLLGASLTALLSNPLAAQDEAQAEPAPTLQFYSSNPRNTAVNIRGLGVPFGLTSDGFEQGVGIYVDDVYYSRVASATFDFLDVAQIEVLRGPQGTLYGKNTTAGAINITTNQPSFDFEGRAEVSLGNFEFRQARLAISSPLSERVAARIAFSGTSRRGTIRNVTTGQCGQPLEHRAEQPALARSECPQRADRAQHPVPLKHQRGAVRAIELESHRCRHDPARRAA
jgi:outer membrane receptor protein involved in Fe transport